MLALYAAKPVFKFGCCFLYISGGEQSQTPTYLIMPKVCAELTKINLTKQPNL